MRTRIEPRRQGATLHAFAPLRLAAIGFVLTSAALVLAHIMLA
jgi:hypothetical protein